MASVFKDMKVLDESPSDLDYLGFGEEIERVTDRINNKVRSKQSVIIAYLGSFGVGKSTILLNVKKRINHHPDHWVIFEPWRYSNRNELWDAFVIKLVSKLRNKEEKAIAKIIDDGRRRLPEIVFIVILLFALASIFSVVIYSNSDAISRSIADMFGSHVPVAFFEAYLKYAVPVIIPGTLFAGLAVFLSLFASSDPLKRTFQLEDMLLSTLKSINEPVLIVIEDIDRSGDDGLVFMETLHEFVNTKKSEFNQPIIIIAPQSLASFNALDLGKDRIKHIEHSLKVYDEKIYFAAKIEHAHVDTLYSKLKFKKKYEKYKPTMVEVTKELNYYYKKDQLTIRMLKHALREVDWFIEANPGCSPSIALVYALACVLRNSTSSTGARLAVSALRGRARLGANGIVSRHITDTSVLLACLGVAAGADGSGVSAGFIDDNGKYTQSASIDVVQLLRDKDGNAIVADEVEIKDRTLNIYVRDTYSQQFTA